MAAVEQSPGDAGGKLGQGGAPIDDDHTGIAAHIAEGLVMWAGDNVAAVAAHEAELGTWDGRKRFVPGISRLPGRGVCGFGVVKVHGGDGGGMRRKRWR